MNKIHFHDRCYVPVRSFMFCPQCKDDTPHGTTQAASGACVIGGFRGIGRERCCKACGYTWRTLELNEESVAMLVDIVGGVEMQRRGKGKRSRAQKAA